MPEPDYITTQGATEPIFAQQIVDSLNPNGIDLTGATAALVLQGLTPTGTVSISNATSGIVQWQPSVADTLTAGSFYGKWQITWADGNVSFYPTDGYVSIRIEATPASLTTSIASLPEVKDHLNMPGNRRVSDDRLLGWLAGITLLIEHEVGPVVVRQFEEWHWGGSVSIRLRHRPSVNLGTTPVLTLIACSEYMGPIEWPLTIIQSPDLGQLYSCMLDPRLGTVVRRTAGGGVQPFADQGPQSVHIVYQAGQSVVPANVREAALETVRVWYETTMAVGPGSQTRADDLDAGAMVGMMLPPSARRLLGPNRRHPAIA